MNNIRKTSIIVSIIFLASTATAFSFNTENSKAAYIDLSGTISASGPSSAFASTGISPESVRELNERADEEAYDAIIYEINSGGGTVVASKEIMREIDSVEVPTICRFRDVSASGAYLFSLGCDEIVADSSTITGSIGVKSSYLEFSEALEEYGVEYIDVSSGEFKGVGDPFMNSTEQDRELMQNRSSQIHQQFLELVQERRNLTDNQIQEVGDGRVILGVEAKEQGLVDYIGGREKAESVAENLTDSSLEFQELSTRESFNLFSMLSASISQGLSTLFADAPITAEL